VKRICRAIFGIAAALSALLCAVTLPLYFSSPADIRLFSVLTPGAQIWRIMIYGPTVRLAWIRPWPGLSHTSLRIRYVNSTRFSPGVTVTTTGFQTLSRSTVTGIEFNSWNVFMGPWPSPEWYKPILIMTPAAAPSSSPGMAVSVIYMPLSTARAALAIFPAIWLVLALRRHLSKKPKEGHCAVCGYDLRATPEKCPECGTIQQTAS
jgi:hypothetical protein